MFDFLLSEKEKKSKLFLTNYKMAFDYIPKLFRRCCSEDAPVNILRDVSKWKKELKTELKDNFYGRNMPKVFHRIDRQEKGDYLVFEYLFTSIGMMTEPMCLVGVIDIHKQKYRLFCLERFMGEKYFLCGVDVDLHENFGIDYIGAQAAEFVKQAEKMAFEHLQSLDNDKEKKETSEQNNTQGEVLSVYNKCKWILDEGVRVLNQYHTLSEEGRFLAYIYCASLLWDAEDKKISKEHNRELYRTIYVETGLFEHISANVAEKWLNAFLTHKSGSYVATAIYNHQLDDSPDFEPNEDYDSSFEQVLSNCAEELKKMGAVIGFAEDMGAVRDPNEEIARKADLSFLTLADKEKKIIILAALYQGGVLTDNWRDLSIEEFIYRARFLSVIREEDGIKHLVIRNLSDISLDEMNETYLLMEPSRCHQFAMKYSQVIQEFDFHHVQQSAFPKNSEVGVISLIYDDSISGSTQELEVQAKNGNYEAYNNLAIKCGNEEETIKYFKLAANLGSANAAQNLWAHYNDCENYEEAIRWMQLAATRGHIYALWNLGCWSYWGIHMEKNVDIALACFKQLASKDWDAPEYSNETFIIKDGNLQYWAILSLEHRDSKDVLPLNTILLKKDEQQVQMSDEGQNTEPSIADCIHDAIEDGVREFNKSRELSYEGKIAATMVNGMLLMKQNIHDTFFADEIVSVICKYCISNESRSFKNKVYSVLQELYFYLDIDEFTDEAEQVGKYLDLIIYNGGLTNDLSLICLEESYNRVWDEKTQKVFDVYKRCETIAEHSYNHIKELKDKGYFKIEIPQYDNIQAIVGVMHAGQQCIEELRTLSIKGKKEAVMLCAGLLWEDFDNNQRLAMLEYLYDFFQFSLIKSKEEFVENIRSYANFTTRFFNEGANIVCPPLLYRLYIKPLDNHMETSLGLSQIEEYFTQEDVNIFYGLLYECKERLKGILISLQVFDKFTQE